MSQTQTTAMPDQPEMPGTENVPWDRAPTEIVGVTCDSTGQRIRRNGYESLVRLDDVTKSFGSLNVMRNFSLDFKRGQNRSEEHTSELQSDVCSSDLFVYGST